jgi:hypothetical protein
MHKTNKRLKLGGNQACKMQRFVTGNAERDDGQ